MIDQETEAWPTPSAPKTTATVPIAIRRPPALSTRRP
jgi:hypothetical protein